jgi:hypothetical protein
MYLSISPPGVKRIYFGGLFGFIGIMVDNYISITIQIPKSMHHEIYETYLS